MATAAEALAEPSPTTHGGGASTGATAPSPAGGSRNEETGAMDAPDSDASVLAALHSSHARPDALTTPQHAVLIPLSLLLLLLLAVIAIRRR